MSKSRDAFRTISEVSDALDTPAHVLRFWESKFSQVKPVKRAGGRRYYRPSDIELLSGIKKLLHDDGMTIKGAQKLLREKGIKHVAAVGATALDTGLDDTGLDETGTNESGNDESGTDNIGLDTVEHSPIKPASAPEPVSAAPEPAGVDISNVVKIPPKEDEGPALTLDASPNSDPEPEAAPETKSTPVAPLNIPDDPADADSKASARLFHLVQKAPHDKLAAKAQEIAPLLDRMQVLRDRIAAR